MADQKGITKEFMLENNPRIKYDFYFKLFGLISTGLHFEQKVGPIKQDRTSSKLRKLYCQLICALLWFFALRSFVLMFISDRSIQLMLGDPTGYWNDYRMYYLMPMLYYALQSAITSTIFLVKEEDLAWLVPFVSLKQMQQQGGHQRPAEEHYSPKNHMTRLNVAIGVNLGLVAMVTASIGLLYYNTTSRNMDTSGFYLWMPWLVLHVLWYFYMAGITMFSMTYFNVICLMLSRRFSQVCKEIEALAESEPGAPGSKNNALTQLYYEHNEVCELVDESNTFWQSYIFFTYMTYIPCNCYALYNLFFADFDDLLGTVTWTTFLHTIFLIGVISISAADVSAEAHAPYTALHTLSLLQLPIDLEVNMSTFLHRVRGPTIGYSCLDLFVVTNASISNTIAAVASYFLIVADFSRSTVAASDAAQKKANAEAEKMANALTNLTTTVLPMLTGSAQASTASAI
ncbi:hypothetical protein HDE_02936 [Halotydeus destructor]|nr:hypothetical protein HDE_02936 [Halotydeus destructor]